MRMRLRELTVRGYRSFAPEPGVTLKDLRSTNLILGPNNVGKSNVVRFLILLRKFLHVHRGAWERAENVASLMELGCALGERDTWLHKRGVVEAELTVEVPASAPRALAQVTKDGALRVAVTMRLVNESHATFEVNPILLDGLRLFVPGADGRLAMRGDVGAVSNDENPPLRLVPASVYTLLADGLLDVRPLRRYQGGEGDGKHSTDGASVIRDLENVSADRTQPSKWARVRGDLMRWLRPLLNEPSLRELTVRGNELTLTCTRADTDLILGLDDLGTGVAQFVILLTFLRLNPEGRVVLIEEPEAHLHPAAVIELLRIVREELGQHQVVMTTHSTSLLDAVGEDWAVFRASMLQGATTIRPLDTAREKLGLLLDLGLRPSQLFLSNCVVWVEGPSDVLYLRRLLADVDAEELSILEGRSHTFVMYGGSLLAHVAFDEEYLCRCLSLSPRNIVVCDRDRGPGEPLKKHVRRLAEEARQLGGSQSVFVLPETAREVENLVIAEVLTKAASAHAGRARRGDQEYEVTLHAESLVGDRRFHEALASGATLSDGAPLSPEATATVAQRIARTKTGIALAVTAEDRDVFSTDGRTFGRLLRDAVRGL